MSFLTLPHGIDFSKTVISFWFRVPRASIDAAAAAFSSDYQDAPPLFNGIIPLVVMGPKGFLQPFTQNTVPYWLPDVPPEGDPSYLLTTTTPTGDTGDELPTNPTCIGINCDPSYGHPVLYINFETNQKAAVSNYLFDLREVEPPSTFTYVNVTDVVTDFSAAISGTNIYLDPGDGSGADQWHHVLISLDFSAIKTHGRAFDEGDTGIDADYVDSAAQLFVAMDDVNYIEFDLSDYFVNGSANPNMVYNKVARSVAGAPQPIGFISIGGTGPIGGIQQYLLSDPNISGSEQPMGLPAPTEFVDNIYRVEMAEFQMWTGVTLDTGITANRRAFVGADGKPVEPAGTEDDPRGPGEKLLGKKPQILLHGSDDWIAGHNTGTTGGQFTPHAGIEAWTPDPSLEKTIS